MTAEQKIRQALKSTYDEGDVNAMDVFKGYSPDTCANGWHFRFFGESSYSYLGKSVAEAKVVITTISDEREIMSAELKELQMIEDAMYQDRWE